MSVRGRAGVALLGGLAALAISYGWGPLPGPLRPGDRAPDFSLRRAGGGEPVSLAAHRGQVVLLNFWATWCRPCLEELPAMQRLYDALADEDFELLAVAVDRDIRAARAFGARLGLTFPILLDPERSAAAEFQSYMWPESYLIDRRGRIAARYIGPRPWDSALYVDALRGVLSAAPVGGAPPPPPPPSPRAPELGAAAGGQRAGARDRG